MDWKTKMSIPIQWLAGFFDGEGCINMTVVGKNRRVAVRLYLTNTNVELLQKIQKEYGGLLSQRRHRGHLNWKPYASLVWTSCKAEIFLEKIAKHLFLKQKQAELACDFFKLHNSSGRLESNGAWGGARLRPEIIEKEHTMKLRMHELNRKGPQE